MSYRTFAEVQHAFVDAAESVGWRLLTLDMRGEVALENADHSVEMVLRGVLVTPEFVRTLPDGGIPKPEEPAA